MNERKHIALTEEQIIAAEKGELQLETRDGKKVVQILWLKPPYDQKANDVLISIFEDGETCVYPRTCKRERFHSSLNDLFVSEPAEIKSDSPAEQKTLYEVGEIIQVSDSINFDSFVDNAFFAFFGGYVLTKRDTDKTPSCWLYHRKKKKIVMLEGKVMTVIEAIEYLKNL